MKSISHNKLVNKIISEYQKAEKHKYTSLFIYGLSRNKPILRSGLSVFAIMQSFPAHTFRVAPASLPNKELFEKMTEEDKRFVERITPCAICSNFEAVDLDLELVEIAFSEVGGLIGCTLLDYCYYLQETNKLNVVSPCEEDFRIFSEILTILSEADENDTVKKTVQSKIGKIKGFKSNTEQRQALLETLGYCSILETPKHKGFLEQYTNLASAPKKTHSSDWNYPVDFWLGKDGINKQAFKFWFEEYIELEKFWK